MAGCRPMAGVIASVVVVACGSSPAAITSASPTTTVASTTLAPTLEIVKGVEYHDASGWTTNTLDIYYGPGAQDGPVVVLFHGQPAPKDFPLYVEIASALVERGAVVFVPDWGNPAATAE